MASTRVGYRHHCANRDAGQEWQRKFHTERDGKPRAKACTYCRGPLVVEYGVWGLFDPYTKEHPESAAVRTFTSRAAADKGATEHAETHGYSNAVVVRWCRRGDQPAA
ncbi:hypothetical protein [Nocardia brasiliensis]|uniref:hypothetical protein n=1 Tax=Nocardia brasiliensis TaxID=37326 RepID=UPI002458056E|nr:hypothetical protein [Nocardia brasiliensis]